MEGGKAAAQPPSFSPFPFCFITRSAHTTHNNPHPPTHTTTQLSMTLPFLLHRRCLLARGRQQSERKEEGASFEIWQHSVRRTQPPQALLLSLTQALYGVAAVQASSGCSCRPALWRKETLRQPAPAASAAPPPAAAAATTTTTTTTASGSKSSSREVSGRAVSWKVRQQVGGREGQGRTGWQVRTCRSLSVGM